MTFGTFLLYLLGAIALVIAAFATLPFIAYPFARMLQARECQECGRRLQRRGGSWFCPFHDDGSPYP
jgi:hypothetical protein